MAPDLIATGLERWTAFWAADGTAEQFIAHPTTWLNNSRYLQLPTCAPAQRVVGRCGHARLMERRERRRSGQ